MTIDEAIKQFEERLQIPDYKTKIPKYYEAMELAVEVLEKQVPKKVYHFIDDDTFETSCCGTDVTNEDCKYCPECGQLLGEVEEIGENEQ